MTPVAAAGTHAESGTESGTETGTEAGTRLLLRPGTPVLRRDERTLQVGLRAPYVATVPDVAEVGDLLARLTTGAALPDRLPPVAAEALTTLRQAGVALVGDAGPRVGSPVEVARARTQFGDDGVRRLAARARQPVGIRADEPVRGLATALLADAGAVVDEATPTVLLVVATGPLLRAGVDPLLRSGTPHLLVSGDAGGRRLGPFVEPGRTACLRCVDAHEAEADPRRPFLLEQAALAASDDVPLDPVLDRLALAWAVRDLCRYLEGDEPSTWSATVDLDPTGSPTVTPRLRHPHCGCAWDLLHELP